MEKEKNKRKNIFHWQNGGSWAVYRERKIDFPTLVFDFSSWNSFQRFLNLLKSPSKLLYYSNSKPGAYFKSSYSSRHIKISLIFQLLSIRFLLNLNLIFLPYSPSILSIPFLSKTINCLLPVFPRIKKLFRILPTVNSIKKFFCFNKKQEKLSSNPALICQNFFR